MPRFKCDCGRSIAYEPSQAGKKIRCPDCKKSHLVPDDASHYLKETARVLARGGTLFATFFVVDEFALSEVRAGRTQWLRQERPDGVWIHDPAKPELAVGYPPEWIEKTMLDAGLTIDAIRFGSWCSRSEPVDYQDIVIASARGR